MSDDKKQADKRKKENYNIEKNGIFFCKSCWIAWDDDGFESLCPECKTIRRKVHHAYKNLIKTKDSDKRQTDEGRARIAVAVAERNHSMSKEQKSRVRLNPVKHGRYMVVSGVFPAKKNKYPQCMDCPIKDQCDNKGYCPTKTDNLEGYRLKFLAAYKNGDIKNLDDYAGLMQANSYAALSDMFQDLFLRGPVIEEIVVNHKDNEPVTIIDDEGNIEILKRLTSHPVLQHIPKFLDSLGMTADQRKMTQKAKGEISGDNLEKAIKQLFGIKSEEDEKQLTEYGIEIDFGLNEDEDQSRSEE